MTEALELRYEVEEILKKPVYFTVLPTNMLTINPSMIEPPDLRAWLFEVYTFCEDYEACEDLNGKVRASFNYIHSMLQDESLELCKAIFKQRERWSDTMRNFRY